MGGLCSNSRSGGYKTDGAGDGGAGGEDEAKAEHVVLQGVHTDSVSCVSKYVLLWHAVVLFPCMVLS